MNQRSGSRVGYLLIGMGIGSALGILMATKSGKDTRDYLTRKAQEGREYAQNKMTELRERAEDVVERGKDAATQQVERVSGAINVGRETYRQAKSEAPVNGGQAS